jgi:hypothetical protein
VFVVGLTPLLFAQPVQLTKYVAKRCNEATRKFR